MKRSGSLWVAAAVTLTSIVCGAAGARAQDNGAIAVSGDRQMMTGTVVSEENNQLVITTNKGDRMTFQVAENAFEPINLVPGSAVEVTYTSSGGQYVTDRILMAYPGGVSSGLASNQGVTYGTGGAYASNQGGTYSGSPTWRDRNRSRRSAEYVSSRGVTRRSSAVRGGETGNGGTRSGAVAGNETGNGNKSDLAANETTTTNTAGNADEQNRIPSTASPLPLIALAGLLSAAAGLGIRKAVRSHKS